MAAGGELSESKHSFPTDYVLILMLFCLYRNLMLMYVCVHVCVLEQQLLPCVSVLVCVFMCACLQGLVWELCGRKASRKGGTQSMKW